MLQRLANGSFWRRRPESNRRIKVLQTSALPLGYVAIIRRRKDSECSEPCRERQYCSAKRVPRSVATSNREVQQDRQRDGGDEAEEAPAGADPHGHAGPQVSRVVPRDAPALQLPSSQQPAIARERSSRSNGLYNTARILPPVAKGARSPSGVVTTISRELGDRPRSRMRMGPPAA